MKRGWRWFWGLAVGIPIAVFIIWGLWDNARLFLITLLNGLSLASLYFIVAAGFTLVFGLMRNVNLAHGSLYLLGGYIGYFVALNTGWWWLALIVGFAGAALAGLFLEGRIFWVLAGHEVRPTMGEIGV